MVVGMAVSGTYMNGATITGITGTTLTLSQRPYSIYTTGTYQPLSGNDRINIPSGTSGISVGMYVWGSFTSTTTTVSAVGANYIQINSGSVKGSLPAGVKTGTPVSVYFIPASPAAGTYAFSADTTYAFRDPASELPFGSFPGVGAYTQ